MAISTNVSVKMAKYKILNRYNILGREFFLPLEVQSMDTSDCVHTMR